MFKQAVKVLSKSGKLVMRAAVLAPIAAGVLAMPLMGATGQGGTKAVRGMIASAEAAENAAPAQAAGDPAAGKAKYASCAICHGPGAEGTGIYPKLVGLSAADAQARLQNLRAQQRFGPHANLSDADIADLSAYIATL